MNLLPWNKGHVLHSSISLFGHYEMAFVHENRIGPSGEFDYKNLLIRRPVDGFGGLTYLFLVVQWFGISLGP